MKKHLSNRSEDPRDFSRWVNYHKASDATPLSARPMQPRRREDLISSSVDRGPGMTARVRANCLTSAAALIGQIVGAQFEPAVNHNPKTNHHEL